jgi:hypothetical protein
VQLLLGQGARLTAVRAVLERQEFADFVQAESEALRCLDEAARRRWTRSAVKKKDSGGPTLTGALCGEPTPNDRGPPVCSKDRSVLQPRRR